MNQLQCKRLVHRNDDSGNFRKERQRESEWNNSDKKKTNEKFNTKQHYVCCGHPRITIILDICACVCVSFFLF